MPPRRRHFSFPPGPPRLCSSPRRPGMTFLVTVTAPGAIPRRTTARTGCAEANRPASSGARSGALCETPERAVDESLLLGHSPAGHPTSRRFHAHCGDRERGVTTELPRASRTDTGRGDESSWAGVAGSGAIVDLDARGKAATWDLAVGTFDPELTPTGPELGAVDDHRVRRVVRGVHDLDYDWRRAGCECRASAIDGGQRMTSGGQCRDAERGTAVDQRHHAQRGRAVPEGDGPGGNSRRGCDRTHRRRQRHGLPGGGRIRRGGQARGG